MSALWTAVRFIYCSLLWGVFGCVRFSQLAPVSLCVQVFVLVRVWVHVLNACKEWVSLQTRECVRAVRVSGTCLYLRHTCLPTATVCRLSRDLWISLCFSCSGVVSIVLLWILIGCQKACNTCPSDSNWTDKCGKEMRCCISKEKRKAAHHMFFHIKTCYACLLRSFYSMSALLFSTVFCFFFWDKLFICTSTHCSQACLHTYIVIFKFHLIWMYCNPRHYKHDVSFSRANSQHT